MFGSFTVFRQLDSMDCGPACLKMVLKHYGKTISLVNLKRASELGRNGVSLLGLSNAAEKYGLHTVGAKLTFEELVKEAPLPSILYWNQNHFVVLTTVDKSAIVIADPAKGLLSLNKKEFLDQWIPGGGYEGKGIALLLSPRPKFNELANESETDRGWKFLARYTFRYKSQIIQLFLGLVLASVIQLIFPYLTQSIVDIGIGTNNLPFIQLILIAQFALFFSRTFVEFIRSRILLFISTHVNLSVLSDFWIKLTRLPISFFESKPTGDIFQRINDHNRIETFITGTTLQTLFSSITFLTFAGVLLFYSAKVFVIFFLGSIFYLLWIRLFLSFRRSIDSERFRVSAKESGMTMQLINGMHEIKLNNAEHLKRWEWERLRASLFKITFRSLKVSQYQQTGAFFINEGKNIYITYIVANSVLEGTLTLGTMLAIQYILGQLNGPVEQLVNFTQQSQDAKISLERLNEIHGLNDEEPADRTFNHRIILNTGIRFADLSFTYPGAGNESVLKNIDVLFPAGKITAIVGMSGSGKTTLLKLLQKFYEEYTGEIKIDETNFSNISPSAWRSLTGSVMQDGYIFNDTIEKNIALGDESPDYDQLVHACKIANIMSFIDELPLGFSTKISVDGKGISAGQKQRLLIARVIYRNPKIVFFDEATNALDANNEKVIMENLQKFFGERTVLIVAHRLSTVIHADKILVLERGRIIEEGNHEMLVSKKGKYYELIKNQLELGT